MSTAEMGHVVSQEVQSIGLKELHDSFIYCLGYAGHPLRADALIAALPPQYKEAFACNVKNLSFSSKEMAREDVAFIDHFFANEHGCIAYSYEDEGGYILNAAGQDYYAIMIVNEQQTAIIPEAQPPTDSVARSVGGGTLAAIWST